MESEITGNMIRILREKRGYTQKQLADVLGVSDKAVSKWETQKGLPDISMLEPLAAALNVSVNELMTGEHTENHNVSGNMQRGKFYRCPSCGNVIFAAGEGIFFCCGNRLEALKVNREEDAAHTLVVEPMEMEYYVSVDHPMTKEHSISFLAYVTGSRAEILKMYPEQEAEGRFFRRGHGMLYACCNQHGLFGRRV